MLAKVEIQWIAIVGKNKRSIAEELNLQYIKTLHSPACASVCQQQVILPSVVSSCLDAGNSILYGIEQCQLQDILRIQNTATKIITDTGRYEYIITVLHQPYWLPIQEQIEFNILCLMYNDLQLLQVPLPSLKYAGDRSFPKAAPMLFNALRVTSFSSSL